MESEGGTRTIYDALVDILRILGPPPPASSTASTEFVSSALEKCTFQSRFVTVLWLVLTFAKYSFATERSRDCRDS